MGEIITLHNSTLFELSEGSLFYRVVKGTVYLFAVEHLKSGLDSARTEIATYHEGDIILSLPPVRVLRFVLSGTLDSQIEPAGMELFDVPGGDELLTQALAKVSGLLRRGLSQKVAFPEVLEAPDREAAVKEFAESLSIDLLAIRAADSYDEKVFFMQRQAEAEAAYDLSLKEIKSVLEEDKSFGTISEDTSPVVQVAQLVAQYDHIVLQPIQGKSYNEEDALSELVKDNNIRTRVLDLKDGWWKTDSGAIFGYCRDAHVEPCALLPEKTGGYLCVIPHLNKRFKVTDKNAQLIIRHAIMFYKPMGSERLSFKDVLKFASSSRKTSKDIQLFIILGILSAVVGLLVPALTRMFVDSAIPQSATNLVMNLSFLVLLCIVSAGIFDIVKVLAMTRLATREDFLLQSSIMDRLLKLPVNFFKHYAAGNLAQKVLTVTQLTALVFGSLLLSVMTGLFASVYLIQLHRYSKYLVKWGLFFALVPVVVTVILAYFKLKWNNKIIPLTSKISGTLFEIVSGINKLILTASEKRAFSLWARLFSKQQKYVSKASNSDIVFAIISEAYPLFVTLCMYALFMSALKTGKIDPLSTGQFLAFMAAFTAFQTSLSETSMTLMQSIMIIPMYKEIKVILDAEPEVQEAKPSIAKCSGAIELSHISFRYDPNTPLLINDLSMKIEPGEFVALVGESGSGKSTLMRILLGFEKPETGSVFYDHQDLASFDAGSIRRKMGVVLQNSGVMQGSIYSNIVGGSPLPMEDAWRAADAVGLGDVIRELPMGMQTFVSAGGSTFSGGQRQRLVIARAIVHNPSILILDEATSALDNLTQAQVKESLEALNVTRIVVAHRLSTIINADRIYVLNHGHIEESGTYEELMKKGGFFAELAKRQQA
ncbi:MAG: NHLP bacteriocin export ABC transporter permease/ATPase subunit [Spirochaetia bacterium]|nr:NHLP bacteriocin export ABC transporter permease/ATPase subunit [Spirochaetia bacterium]